jgi:hypothetical protein
MAAELARYLRGWLGYFGQCETPSVLEGLEQWFRRRLALAIAMPNAYFDSLGIPRLTVVR